MDELGTAPALEARRFVVRGRVQGVGFRWFTLEVARRMGVDGWARNLPDGSVLVEAAAPTLVLDSFVVQLQMGPPSAHVVEVRAEARTSSDPLPHPFRIQP